MSFSFVSCGDDDDDDNNDETTTTASNLTGGGNGETIIDEPKDDAITVELVAGEKFALPDSTLDWISENTKIASVSEDGNYIEAKHVGTTKVWCNTYKYKVTVNPKYTLYADPCMAWGASLETISQYMSQYRYCTQSNDYYYYYGKDAAGYYGYHMGTTGLDASVVFVGTSYVEDLIYFLFERYQYGGSGESDDDTLYFFLNLDEDMLVTMKATPVSLAGVSYIMVLYLPYASDNSTKTRGSMTFMSEKINNIYKQMDIEKSDLPELQFNIPQILK
ncbi:MAG: hypothetical protein ACI4TW_04710 [Prevotella sp.]